MAVLLILRSLGNHHLGRQQQTGNGRGVLQCKTRDLGRIQNSGLQHVTKLARRRVVTERALAVLDAVEDHSRIFTGVVNDSELRALYSAARVYACPSLYEGFGFTVLEAMACDTPVVCSRETSLPEIAGDAALYADPRNPQEFGNALREGFTHASLRDTLIRKGKVNVRRFIWDNAARQTLGVYQDALRVSLGRTRPGVDDTSASSDKSLEAS